MIILRECPRSPTAMTVKGLEMRWHKDVTSHDLARDNSTGVERKDANAAERWVGGSRSEDTRRTQRVLAESFDTAACLEIFKIKKKNKGEKGKMPTTNNKVFTLPSRLSTTDSRSGNCRSSPIFLLAPNSSAFVLFVSRTALQSNALCGGKLGP